MNQLKQCLIFNASLISALTVDGDPLIEIFSLWQHDRLPQVPTAQRSFSMFQQFILMGALWDVFLGLESLG